MNMYVNVFAGQQYGYSKRSHATNQVIERRYCLWLNDS